MLRSPSIVLISMNRPRSTCLPRSVKMPCAADLERLIRAMRQANQSDEPRIERADPMRVTSDRKDTLGTFADPVVSEDQLAEE